MRQALKIATLRLVVVVLLGVVAVFALLALLVPAPIHPGIQGHPTPEMLRDYYHEVYVYSFLLLLFRGYGPLAIGFAALADLVVIVEVAGPKMPKGPKPSIHRAVRDTTLLGAVAGVFIFFSIFVLYDIASTSPNDRPNPLLVLGPNECPGPASVCCPNAVCLNHYYVYMTTAFFAHEGPPHPVVPLTFGEAGFVLLTAATLCVFVYRLNGKEDLLTALTRTVTLFAAPVIVAFEFVLLIFIPTTMSSRVTNFLIGTALEKILTNWFVLVIASGLFVLELAHRRSAVGVRRET
ncbi:MAG: hypothetical protein ABSB53_06185 [Nitrososphaerales archaeon]|jgi:hypothetical protein